MEEEIIDSSNQYIKEGCTYKFQSTMTLVYDKPICKKNKICDIKNDKNEANLTDLYSNELLKLRNDSSFTGSSTQLQYLMDVVLK